MLLTRGDGTFRAPIDIDVGPILHTSAAVGDVNGEGKLDLVRVGQRPAGARVRAASPTSRNYDTDGAHGPIVLSDFNGDG